jgi:hypothetical protein
MGRIVSRESKLKVESSPHHELDRIPGESDRSLGYSPIPAQVEDEWRPAHEAAATLEYHGFGDHMQGLCDAMNLAGVLHRLEQLLLALARIDEKALRAEAERQVRQALDLHTLRHS